MSRQQSAKLSSPAKPPSPETYQLARQQKNWPLALEIARSLSRTDPGIHEPIYHESLIACAQAHSRMNQFVDFNRVMTEALALPQPPANWIPRLAGLFAAAGNLNRGLELLGPNADPNHVKIVQGHACDRALISDLPLPDDLKHGCDIVRSALAKYDAGQDDAAKADLQALGLQSPLLDWKLMIRGLIAHANGDGPRAIENWCRLDPDRLPSQLVASVRRSIEPAVQNSGIETRGSQPVGTVILKSELAGKLHELLPLLARDGLTDKIWRKLDPIVQTMKSRDPDRLPRLRDVMYFTIYRMGQLRDLVPFRKLFGAPADDPQFDRLQAMVLESLNNYAMANSYLAKYETWLAGVPAGWTAEDAAYARALIFHRMSVNLEAAIADAELDIDPTSNPFQMLFQGKKPARRDTTQWKKDQQRFLERSCELAPTWDKPVIELMLLLGQKGNLVSAEAIAIRFLERVPDSLPILKELTRILSISGRAFDALPFADRIVRLNPLDLQNGKIRNALLLSAAIQTACRSEWTALDTLLRERETHWRTLGDHQRLPVLAVQAAARNQVEVSARMADQATADSDYGLMAAHAMATIAASCKLKPALRSQFTSRFKEHLAAEPLRPVAVANLLMQYNVLERTGIVYRGQKTEKSRFLKLLMPTLSLNAPEEEYEFLLAAMAPLATPKQVEQFARSVIQKFPSNITARLMALEQSLERTSFRRYQADAELNIINQLLERSQDPPDVLQKQRDLRDRLKQKLHEQYADFFDLFRPAFGNTSGNEDEAEEFASSRR